MAHLRLSFSSTKNKISLGASRGRSGSREGQWEQRGTGGVVGEEWEQWEADCQQQGPVQSCGSACGRSGKMELCLEIMTSIIGIQKFFGVTKHSSSLSISFTDHEGLLYSSFHIISLLLNFVSYKMRKSASPNLLHPLGVRQNWIIFQTVLNRSAHNIPAQNLFVIGLLSA